METRKRKSILKQDLGSARKETKKRLSFAVEVSQSSPSMLEMGDSPRSHKVSFQDIVPKKIQDQFDKAETSQAETTTTQQNVSDVAQLQASIEVTHMCQSIRITSLGLCYVPQPKDPNVNRQQLPVGTVNDSQRNYYLTSLKSTAAKYLNIVIAGNKSVGEGIKTELICRQAHYFYKRSRSSEITLNVINEDSPSVEVLQQGDFFIFLVCFEILSSLRTISNVMNKISIIGAKPSINGLVLAVCPSQETYKSVLTLEEFHNFLDEHQLVHFWWSNTGRAQKKQIIRKLLKHIHTSMGYTTGTSCLMKSLVLRGVKEYQDQSETVA